MVARLSIETINADDLHLDALPRATSKAFLYSAEQYLFSKSGWYLAGGTALALQAGHRKSVDLDFFTAQKTFDREVLIAELDATKKWETSLQREGTLYGTLLKAKMSFIAYPFFEPSPARLAYGNVRILVPEDIAAMKIIAISQRGRKRDFVDLYWYAKNREPIIGAVKRALKQYPGREHNLPHIIKSFAYFDDAESDPMPELYFDATWKSIKMFFKKEARALAEQLLV